MSALTPFNAVRRFLTHLLKRAFGVFVFTFGAILTVLWTLLLLGVGLGGAPVADFGSELRELLNLASVPALGAVLFDLALGLSRVLGQSLRALAMSER